MPKKLSRRAIVGAIPAFVALSSCSALSRAGSSGSSSADQGGPIVFGVSGPVTGSSAEYGQYWKEGFDLALEELNAAGESAPPDRAEMGGFAVRSETVSADRAEVRG